MLMAHIILNKTEVTKGIWMSLRKHSYRLNFANGHYISHRAYIS